MNAPDIPFPFDAAISAAVDRIEPKVIAWRRDFHQNPELGNRELRTAKIVADHLRALGFDQVREKVAHTGVVGILKGGLPGSAVALRADMDALPVAEEVDVAFKSTARTQWNGQECGVMHACGHDAHTSILMGVAEVLAGMRERIPGTITFVFQAAVRHNIIPDEVKLEGTIRAFDETQRDEIHTHVKRIAEMIAAAGGATAKVHIHRWYDVTVNDPGLTEWSIPTLSRIAGEARVNVVDKICGAEDFSFYQKAVPGFFYFMGCTPPERDAGKAAPNHSPRFYVDENCLKLGVRTLSALALDWLTANVD